VCETLKPKVSGCEANSRVSRVDFPVPLGAERTIGGSLVGPVMGGCLVKCIVVFVVVVVVESELVREEEERKREVSTKSQSERWLGKRVQSAQLGVTCG